MTDLSPVTCYLFNMQNEERKMKRYKHVIVIGIDGMGNFNRQADTPNFDRIFARGAVTYDALSLDPTISAQNWGAMLLGCHPLVHKLTNGYISSREYTVKERPSVFKRIRDAYPDDYLSSVCNWDPINVGLIENGLGVTKLTADDDGVLTDIIVEEVRKKPTFLFVQTDQVDGAGHHWGYGTEEYIRQIELEDGYVGRIYDEYVNQGIIDDTLFIVTADHGGYKHSHGGYNVGERLVFLGAAGRGVSNGEIGRAYTSDICAIVLYALGLPVPEYGEHGVTTQVPLGIFEGYTGEYRVPDKMTLPERVECDPVSVDQLAGLGKEPLLVMNFENECADALGAHEFKEYDTIKYYSDGPVGACAELGSTGFAVTDPLPVGEDNLTVMFWFNTDLSLDEDAVVCGNKNWLGNRDGQGFLVAVRSHDLIISSGNGDDCFERQIAFPERSSDGWTHIAIAFDKERQNVRIYLDFALYDVEDIPDDMLLSYDSGNPLVIGNDTSLKFNQVEKHNFFRIDDLILLRGAADGEYMENIGRMYGV